MFISQTHAVACSVVWVVPAAVIITDGFLFFSNRFLLFRSRITVYSSYKVKLLSPQWMSVSLSLSKSSLEVEAALLTSLGLKNLCRFAGLSMSAGETSVELDDVHVHPSVNGWSHSGKSVSGRRGSNCRVSFTNASASEMVAPATPVPKEATPIGDEMRDDLSGFTTPKTWDERRSSPGKLCVEHRSPSSNRVKWKRPVHFWNIRGVVTWTNQNPKT